MELLPVPVPVKKLGPCLQHLDPRPSRHQLKHVPLSERLSAQFSSVYPNSSKCSLCELQILGRKLAEKKPTLPALLSRATPPKLQLHLQKLSSQVKLSSQMKLSSQVKLRPQLALYLPPTQYQDTVSPVPPLPMAYVIKCPSPWASFSGSTATTPTKPTASYFSSTTV